MLSSLKKTRPRRWLVDLLKNKEEAGFSIIDMLVKQFEQEKEGRAHEAEKDFFVYAVCVGNTADGMFDDRLSEKPLGRLAGPYDAVSKFTFSGSTEKKAVFYWMFSWLDTFQKTKWSSGVNFSEKMRC